MKKLDKTATITEVKTVAAKFGLEIENDVVLNLWEGDSFKGGFAELDSVIKALNHRVDLFNISVDEKQKAQSNLEQAMGNATAAAIMDGDQVIGCCETNEKRGGEIEVAGAVSSDGSPVNTTYFKISRSKANLMEALLAPPFTAQLHNGQLFYVK